MLIKKNDITYENGRLKMSGETIKTLKKFFPDKDVVGELYNMEQWLLTHPPKRNWNTFVVGWLRRSNNKKYQQSYNAEGAVAKRTKDLLADLSNKWKMKL